MGLGGRQVRLPQSGRAEEAALAGSNLESIPATGPRGLLQGRARSLRRDQQGKSDVQEALRQHALVPQRLHRLEPGGGARLRQLHDADAHAHLIGSIFAKRKAPEQMLRGFFYCLAGGGWPKSSGGKSGGASISILTFDGSSPVPAPSLWLSRRA